MSTVAGGVVLADTAVELAQWAARAFAGYDKATVDRVAEAVVGLAEAKAAEYAVCSAEETDFGVAEHKTVKNLAACRGLPARDLINPRTVDGTVEIPRPVGVVLLHGSATSPVSTVYSSILLALLARNAVIVVPDPLAREVTAMAARTLGEAAVAAGAPDGVVQVVDEAPEDRRVGLVIPAPRLSNVPVLVDDTADLTHTAARLVETTSFDNGTGGRAGSVLVVTDAVADALSGELGRAGGYVLTGSERDRVREVLFPGSDGQFEPRAVGRDAAWIAARAGVAVPPDTRLLLAPIDLVVPEEPLAGPKPCPVLGLVRVASAAHGIRAAKAVLRWGVTPVASVYSGDSRTILACGVELPVRRISVNGADHPADPGMAALPSPEQFVTWTRIAYPELAGPADGLGHIQPAGAAPRGPVPAYPHPSNRP
jgi:acyl-CoA reductase-like NAD-dependent aldehyde dehydrogenase